MIKHVKLLAQFLTCHKGSVDFNLLCLVFIMQQCFVRIFLCC